MTDAGVENLYSRMDRMTSLQPIFVDITWGAGGSTKDLTIAICEHSQKFFGVDALMHLTCTNLSIDDIKVILSQAKESGIQNILALRGDPPKGAVSWEPIAGGCANAIDLVKLIRKEYGNHFGIAVAGFPEGHPNGEGDIRTDIAHLKEKVDAGADFILTNFFYDTNVFIDYVTRCREAGITCPIIPGMMPVQSFSSFKRMTAFCRTHVPDKIWNDLNPIADDDSIVKAYGVKLCVEMCTELFSTGITHGFHFYTLNLERSVVDILKQLGIDEHASVRRNLPWRGSRTNLKGLMEDVRPINWANRPKSYIQRTISWDEFPNGRWGDGRSPAFGELSGTHFYKPVEGTKEDRMAMWGEAPITPADIHEIFAKYVEHRIPIIPWCEAPLQPETSVITTPLAAINRAGFMTINSQPSANAVKSDHPLFGWGGSGGRVYQRSYVEFFCSPSDFELINGVARKYTNLAVYAVNSAGDCLAKDPEGGVTALTWGVFPNKEILQPTIFDFNTFVVWSKESFQLWIDAWASLYDDDSESADLLYMIHDSYYLVAIIDNDFIDSNLYEVFDEILAVKTQQSLAEDENSDATLILS